MAEGLNTTQEETITAEDRIEQLTAEIAKLKTENTELADANTKLKVTVSKANSEAAENKRKWQQTLSDAEKAEEARKEAEAETKAQLEELLTEKKIAGVEAEFMGLGFDKTMAAGAAKALIDGRMDELFVGLSKFKAETEQKAVENALKDTPKPEGKNAPAPETKITKADIAKMDYFQLLALKEKDPELYKRLTS